MRFNIYAQFGSQVSREFPSMPARFSFFRRGPNFSMPIFDLTLWRRLQSAHQGIRASEAQEMGVREQTVLLVVSQYLGALRAGAAVVAAQSRVDLAQALYDQASDLQKNGVGTGLGHAARQRGTAERKAAPHRGADAGGGRHYGLVRLLNLDPHQKVELADQPSFFQTPEFEASQSLEQAIATRPEMTSARGAREDCGAWKEGGQRIPAPQYQPQRRLGLPGPLLGQLYSLLYIPGFSGRAALHQRQDPRPDCAVESGT